MRSREEGRANETHRARSGRRALLLLLLVVVNLLCVSTGCGRWSARRQPAFSGATPTTDEIVAMINRNAERAQSLIARNLDITSNQVPLPLDGKLALEKPRRFRMQVFAPVTHKTVADLGSNDDEFWVYSSPPNQRASLIHCSYVDYGRIQSPLPFQPDWILEAVGILPVPPEQEHQLQPGKRGTWELVSPTKSPQGQPASLVTVVQPETGYILERRLEVPGQSRPIARAILSRHQKDPTHGFIYPTSIAISCPEQDFDFKIQMSGVQVNPHFDAYQSKKLWRLPREEYVLNAEDEIDLGARARQGRPSHPPATQPGLLQLRGQSVAPGRP